MALASLTSALVLLQAPFAGHLISGEATIRERMALPPTAELEVTLDRVSGGISTRVAQGISRLNGNQSPLKFSFHANLGSVRGGSYTLRARVIHEGKTMFQTAQPAKYVPGTKIRTILPLVRAEAPRSDIKGIQWTLIALEGQPYSGNADARPWITFNASSNQLSGYTGVNSFGGTYALPGTSVQIDLGAMTLRAGSEDQMRLEQSFLRVLERANGYRRMGDRLSLLRGQKELALFAHKVN